VVQGVGFFVDGEESALLPLPQLKPALRAGLSTPHHSGTQVPQRLLMRLRRGRLCSGQRIPTRSTDSPSCGLADELRPPRCAAGLLAPLRYANGLPLRCGGADHQTILRSVPSFHEARQRSCHASCGPPPGGSELDLCSASEGTPGRLRVGQVGRCHLAGARPRSIGAGPGKERERCSLAARRCACAALRRLASGISCAAWP